MSDLALALLMSDLTLELLDTGVTLDALIDRTPLNSSRRDATSVAQSYERVL
jgi:hypothetical protein